MNLWLEFGLNAVVATLLAVTLVYCLILNKRIRMLQDSRSELAELLKHFDESTSRASESILALQSASKKIGETIQARIEKASYTMDDLNFLIERASQMTNNMEAGLAVARQREKSEAPPRRREVVVEEAIAKPTQRVKPAAPKEPEEAPARSIASLQAMLDKIARKGEEKPAIAGKPRSEAEKELLEMLRASKS